MRVKSLAPAPDRCAGAGSAAPEPQVLRPLAQKRWRWHVVPAPGRRCPNAGAGALALALGRA
eukprot:6768070-Lingulodinium_polyedra.AAC.1